MKEFNEEQLTTLAHGTTDLLQVIGDDVNRSGVIETPGRVAQAYAEIFAHTGETEFTNYKLFPAEKNADMVVIRDIPFYSMCEHHLLPFFGTVDVAYIPTGEIIGLSKVPRLVDWVARRPQVQENITTMIGDELQRILNPAGIAIYVKARHMCMEMRGINQPGDQTVTNYYLGKFKDDANSRLEFLLNSGVLAQLDK
ncbi:GTP cyclohydrolase I FolE [Periweissella cryptocerci]|uniref:GTP cyclohydrolase 1 n=1 Tax=Periweissella cryptocerci TaxID=2506420 RepID=A0A4P6YRJ7_9LACO|nr:GTP cyclohydrolase I FolE [Periweissella cryptocerci]QBO35241.1 GTP cyclohydrolase I FolE [Periweissella cryptocerci]